MQIIQILFGIFYLLNTFNSMDETQQSQPQQSLFVPKCTDFELTGKGDNEQWDNTEWIQLAILDESENIYESKFKMLYSEMGIYVLGSFEDNIISTEYTEDQGDIWNGDVFEVFLQTDPSNPLYFEYEINPLNAELAILVPNNEGDFFGWSPWHYEGPRKIKKAVQVYGGKGESGATISSWRAELFFPYALFKAMKNVPPKSGTEWQGNFYRMDYDSGNHRKWSWAPVESSFHEYKKYWPIIFK